MREYTVRVIAEEAGRRLDLFLLDFSKKRSLGFSRTHIQRLISSGNVLLSNSIKPRAHYKVCCADELKVIIEDKKSGGPGPEEIPLDVVYEDEHLAVINKPAGLVVHPAPGNYEHTLVNALLYRFKKLSDINPQRPGIVHRLDKDTSGLIVIAKDNVSHLALAGQFAQHSIKRKYVALVKGEIEFDENVIELPIGRHPLKRKNMSVSFNKNAKYARTRYRTLKRAKEFSLLELEPYTGRTHQLRVHLAFINHPIMGDSKYGRENKFARLALHAKYLGFAHPDSGKFMEFETKIPDEFHAKNL